MTYPPRSSHAIFLVLICFVCSCGNLYVSASSRDKSTGFPGDSESAPQGERNKYPANPGVVQVFGSMDELKGYNYEPLTTLTETNQTGARAREEMIASLQKRAGELGANAIAIVDEQGKVNDITKIRVNAVRILGTKKHNH